MKYAKIDVNAATDNIIIAPAMQPGGIIVVVSYVIVAAGAVNAKFQSKNSGTTTELTGPFPMVAQTVVEIASAFRQPSGITGLFATVTAGDNLVLTLDAAVQVSGHIAYEEIPV